MVFRAGIALYQQLIEIHQKSKLIRKILPEQKLCSGKVYVLSQFVFAVRVNESTHAVYNTLTKQCFSLPYAPDRKRVFSADEIAGDPDLTALMKGYFLVPDGTDECGFYNKLSLISRTFRKSAGYHAYTILPTFACNARCVYCYEEGTVPISMNAETVRQTIEFIKRTRRKTSYVYLLWFGGEPLLRPDIIDEVSRGMTDAGLEFYSGMVTNGSLITEEIIRRMKDLWKLSSIQISMDGAEADYKRRKNYYVYDDTYAGVIRNIDRIAAESISVSVRLNVDHDNIGDIPSVLHDLAAGIKNRDAVSVSIAPLYGVRNSGDDISIWKKVAELNPLIEEAGFRVTNIANLDRSFRVYRCMGDDPSGNVLIMPDGRLSTCQQYPEESIFGNIWDGVTDPDKLRRFTASDQTREKCRSCVFLPDCTSFANCPVQDFHCKEMRMMKAELMIESMYKKALESEAPDPVEEPEEDLLSHITTSD